MPRNATQAKYRPIYRERQVGGLGGGAYTRVLLPNGDRRSLTSDEFDDLSNLPAGAKPYRLQTLVSPRIRESRTGIFPSSWAKSSTSPAPASGRQTRLAWNAFNSRTLEGTRPNAQLGPPRVNARDPTVSICRRPPDEPNRPVPTPLVSPRLQHQCALSGCGPRRARAGHMGDDRAGVLLEMVPSATPPHARNAPSSGPKGDGDKRKALPYAQLLSQVL